MQPTSAAAAGALSPGGAPSPGEVAPSAAARPGSELDPAVAARLKRGADGLVVAVAQQYDTGEVLMVGWMDDEALHRTLTTGRVTYWSRSRKEYWRKGDTSGHAQWVRSVALDCDGDALLLRVDQVGAACHTGDRTCFDAGALAATATGPQTMETVQATETAQAAGAAQATGSARTGSDALPGGRS